MIYLLTILIYLFVLVGVGFYKEQKIKTINDLYNLELEKIVKKYPEQYFWFHRKWEKDNYA